METAALPEDGTVAELAHDGAVRQKRPSKRLEQLQDAAVAAVRAVAAHRDWRHDLPSFFAHLGGSIASLSHARRAAFWRMDSAGAFTLQPLPFGFPHHSPIYDARLEPGSFESVLAESGLDLRRGTATDLDAMWRNSGLLGVSNSIAAAWRAGDRLLGAVALFDSPHGFTQQDVWVLRLAGLTSGLLWQYKESEAELDQTAGRLEQAVAARRHLMNNIAAGGDEARRRFASALHDDSLQLLTAAELQLERVRSDLNGSSRNAQLDEVSDTLSKVEDSLRRLLTNVSPEPLPAGDLKEAISERLESLRVRTGIEPVIDSRLNNDVPQVVQAAVMKNVSEALNNVEKHARATKVMVAAEVVDGGVRVRVTDDGTGFVAAESARMPGHIGLIAMRERAQLSGGWCRIDSEPGIGTRVEFWIPTNQ